MDELRIFIHTYACEGKNCFRQNAHYSSMYADGDGDDDDDDIPPLPTAHTKILEGISSGEQRAYLLLLPTKTKDILNAYHPSELDITKIFTVLSSTIISNNEIQEFYG